MRSASARGLGRAGGDGEEDVVEARSADGDRTPSTEDAARRSSSSTAARSPCTVPSVGSSASTSSSGPREFDDLAADLRLEPRRRALGGDPAAVEHGDAVGEPVGLLEVLRRQEHGRAGVGDLADDAPGSGGSACRGRSSSSRKITGVGTTRPERRSSRRRIPPEYVATRRPAASCRPKRSSSSSARPRRRPARPESRASMSTFSRPGEHLVDRGGLTGEADARGPSGSPTTSTPATRRAARIGPDERREDVDGRGLSAPFGPRRANTLPASTARSRPSRTGPSGIA